MLLHTPHAEREEGLSPWFIPVMETIVAHTQLLQKLKVCISNAQIVL